MPREKIRIDFFNLNNGVSYKKETVKINYKTRDAIFKAYKNKCAICSIVVKKFRAEIKFFKGDRLGHIDHIIPIARGGMSIVENLQLLCEHCNQKKGAK